MPPYCARAKPNSKRRLHKRHKMPRRMIYWRAPLWAICCCAWTVARPMMICWKPEIWRGCCAVLNGRLLALYADSGIPTRAALLTRFELWIANTAAPDAIRMGVRDNGFYRAVLDWLRTHAVGLVTVRAAPLATAEGDIAMIANALGRGRHDEAAWRMGALLRRMESDRSVNHPDMVSLQLLYDDTRASAEISPMLAALRDDYMAGARP